ncbi:hypothetical protein [Streptomyces sp. NPDC047000]|uniref:hypothetical protein n=1 Tax=Streptomyces sp. NPDC047000 TaxID=3155474 RepID=UPI0033C2482D
MSWTRGPLAALVVCVLMLAGPAGCGSGGAHRGKTGAPPSPVGRLLDRTDAQGRRYREVDDADAPDVEIEVAPDTGNSWDVRLTVHRFRFSPAGTRPRAVPGRGTARLYLDGALVARLRTPRHRLAAGLVPRGTHQLTARLYADDNTVWAVHGKPVQSTADLTESATPEPSAAGPATGPSTGTTAGSGLPAAAPARRVRQPVRRVAMTA